jgi:hypothetical protein
MGWDVYLAVFHSFLFQKREREEYKKRPCSCGTALCFFYPLVVSVAIWMLAAVAAVVAVVWVVAAAS